MSATCKRDDVTQFTICHFLKDFISFHFNFEVESIVEPRSFHLPSVYYKTNINFIQCRCENITIKCCYWITTPILSSVITINPENLSRFLCVFQLAQFFKEMCVNEQFPTLFVALIVLKTHEFISQAHSEFIDQAIGFNSLARYK